MIFYQILGLALLTSFSVSFFAFLFCHYFFKDIDFY